MDIIRLDYSEVQYGVLDNIIEWDSDRCTYACAVLEFGNHGECVYLGYTSGTLVAIALVSPGEINILQFLATKHRGCGKVFVDFICKDGPLALHSMNDARGFYEKCGFTHIGNGNYTKGGD